MIDIVKTINDADDRIEQMIAESMPAEKKSIKIIRDKESKNKNKLFSQNKT